MDSLYQNAPSSEWLNITKEIIKQHPLDVEVINRVVLSSWADILKTNIGGNIIGKDIFPKPQIMGFFLHELISLKLAKLYPKVWRCEKSAKDKDIVCLLNDLYSIEIKTSSSQKSIYGNRSYSQKSDSEKKSKSGYYLAINFEKFDNENNIPNITKIRFGWLDHDDWKGQIASTGQQARLSSDVENNKLITIYDINDNC